MNSIRFWLGRTVYDLRRYITPRRKLRGRFLLRLFGLASSCVFASHRHILAPILTHALRLASLYRVCAGRGERGVDCALGWVGLVDGSSPNPLLRTDVPVYVPVYVPV